MNTQGRIENSNNINLFTPPIQSWGKVCKKPQYNHFDGISNTPFTMNIDTLDLMGSLDLRDIKEDSETIEISNEVVLAKEMVGTPMFISCYTIYLYGESFGKLYCHPRKLTKNLTHIAAFLD